MPTASTAGDPRLPPKAIGWGCGITVHEAEQMRVAGVLGDDEQVAAAVELPLIGRSVPSIGQPSVLTGGPIEEPQPDRVAVVVGDDLESVAIAWPSWE